MLNPQLNPQTSSMILTQEGLDKVNGMLARLLSEINGRYILLVEKSGQAIASVGEQNPFAIPLAALVAGAFSSTREIARMLGEKEFQSMFQQGKDAHIFISLLPSQDILAVVFDENSTVGIVKMRSKQASQELAVEIAKMRGQPIQFHPTGEGEITLLPEQ